MEAMCFLSFAARSSCKGWGSRLGEGVAQLCHLPSHKSILVNSWLCFTAGETKAQSGRVARLRAHSLWVAELGFNPAAWLQGLGTL